MGTFPQRGRLSGIIGAFALSDGVTGDDQLNKNLIQTFTKQYIELGHR